MKRVTFALLVLIACRRETPITETQPQPRVTAAIAERVGAVMPALQTAPSRAARRAQSLVDIAPTSRRRSVASPSSATPATVTIGGFPVADNGRTFRVKCDGALTQCVVENGRCVALLNLVPGVQHSCAWGFDENGNGGVAFLSGTIVIE